MTNRLKLRGKSDTVPNQFTFTDLTNQTESTVVTGSPVTITGINAAAGLSVTGGSVQINGTGSFVTSGVINNNDTVTPRGTANATYLGTTNVVVTIGNTTDTFTITTRANPSSVPASINAPVVGTDLTAIWNLQTSGTGPRTSPTNGTWAGSVNAYLAGLGFALTGGKLVWTIGSSTKTVADYDFGPVAVWVFGTGSAIFNDCRWQGAASPDPQGAVVSNCDVNGNLQSSSDSTLTTTLNYCLLNASHTWLGAGTLNHNYCRYMNQKHYIGSSSFSATGAPHLSYDHCYITGGGVAPASTPDPEHVELIQSNPAVQGTFSCTNCVFNPIDGQATAAPWGSAWTGVWSVGKHSSVTFSNNIHIGIANVNQNTGNPNVISCILAYLVDTANITLTNNVMEAGYNGYTLNQNGSNKPVDGGGNRSFANTALTVANFG